MEQSAVERTREDEPPLDGFQRLGNEWQEIWKGASVFSGSINSADLLDMALGTFFFRYVGEKRPTGEQSTMLIAAVAHQQTHTREALTAAFHRLLWEPPRRPFWTRGRRTVAAGVALWWIAVAAWEFVRVRRDYYGHIQAIDLAVLAPALAGAAYAAYRWVMRR